MWIQRQALVSAPENPSGKVRTGTANFPHCIGLNDGRGIADSTVASQQRTGKNASTGTPEYAVLSILIGENPLAQHVGTGGIVGQSV